MATPGQAKADDTAMRFVIASGLLIFFCYGSYVVFLREREYESFQRLWRIFPHFMWLGELRLHAWWVNAIRGVMRLFMQRIGPSHGQAAAPGGNQVGGHQAGGHQAGGNPTVPLPFPLSASFHPVSAGEDQAQGGDQTATGQGGQPDEHGLQDLHPDGRQRMDIPVEPPLAYMPG